LINFLLERDVGGGKNCTLENGPKYIEFL
jgi:hypothetical protein